MKKKLHNISCEMCANTCEQKTPSLTIEPINTVENAMTDGADETMCQNANQIILKNSTHEATRYKNPFPKSGPKSR